MPDYCSHESPNHESNQVGCALKSAVEDPIENPVEDPIEDPIEDTVEEAYLVWSTIYYQRIY
jgi:hypothetical protein